MAAKKKRQKVTSENRQRTTRNTVASTVTGRGTSTVAARNRQIRQEALREELQAKEYLKQITNDMEVLEKLQASIGASKVRKATISKIVSSLNNLYDDSISKAESKQLKDSAIADILEALHEDLAGVVTKAEAQTRIIKVKMDTNFRRLNKVLPDLKAIELSDPQGNNPLEKFVDMMVKATKESMDSAGNDD